jgi:putative transposase
MAKKEYALAHTKWMCKYHIVFTPKYRRKIIYNQYKEDIRDIIKQLCSYKGVEIIEGHLMPDHIHMLVSIPPKMSVSSFMGYLKGKSALMIFDKHANLKYKFGNRYNGELYAESRRLSENVLDELVAAAGCKKRSIWETDTMSGINWCQVPVTIVEVGYMSNPDEDRLIVTEEYQNKLVLGMANGIDKTFK